jgi:hypothetical protein
MVPRLGGEEALRVADQVIQNAILVFRLVSAYGEVR